MKKIATSFHEKLFGVRCDKKPGISYLDHTDFEGLQMQPFSFQNKHGNTLRGGLYFYETWDKQPLVVFFHGMGGGYLAYMAEIEMLCKGGYRVISYDNTGTFSSDGDALGGFCQSLSDADDALSYVKETFPGESIFLMGHSWGAYTAGCMVNLHPDVKKAILLAPPISMPQMYLQKSPVKMIAKALIALEKEKYPTYWDQSVLGDFSKDSTTQVLIIQSTDDKMIDYKKNFKVLQQQLPFEKVQFVTVKDKNHNPTYTVEAVDYMAAYLKQLHNAQDDEAVATLEKTAQWHDMCQQDRQVSEQILTFFNT